MEQFTDFLLSRGYKLIADNYESKQLIYEYNGLFVKIITERNSHRDVSLSRTNNHSWKGWYDMDVIRFFIINAPYQNDGLSKFEYIEPFFENHYNQIVEAFYRTNLKKTERALMALMAERSRVLFGDEEVIDSSWKTFISSLTKIITKLRYLLFCIFLMSVV